MIKKFITAVAGVGLLLATVVPAFAANQCGNQTTGASSINICTRDGSKLKTVNITNSGSVIHKLFSFTSSGNNTANSNTNGGGVNAGKASATVLKQASLNTGNLTVTQSDPVADETGINDVTGSNSNNTVTLTSTKTLNLTLTNSGDVTHNGTVIVRSGSNSSSNNTVGGLVTTGDSTSDVSMMTIMNDFNITLSQ